jgi:hypothetical protein
LDKDGLRFVVPRDGRERVTLSLRAFFPVVKEGPVWDLEKGPRKRIRAMIGDCVRDPRVLQEAWTYSSTVYDIRERTGMFVPLLAADGRVVTGGEPFFLTLGSDLPPGDKEIFLSTEGKTPCYVLVARVMPGQEDVRNVFAEAKQ